MKSMRPERMDCAPTRIVVATPSRMMTLAALTNTPVPSSPRIMILSCSSILRFNPARYRSS